jgi:PAS domain S-box-containing protein
MPATRRLEAPVPERAFAPAAGLAIAAAATSTLPPGDPSLIRWRGLRHASEPHESRVMWTPRRAPSLPARVAFTVVAVAIATIVRAALGAVLGKGVPFIVYYPTVVLCGWYGGLLAGLLGTVLSGLVAWYFFIPQYFSFAFVDHTAVVQLVLFIVAGSLVSLLAESLHRARRRAEDGERQERDARERLRVTLASVGDAVIATDDTGRITLINAIAQALTGWSEAAAVGRPVEDVFVAVNEVSRQPADNPVRRALREGVVTGLANHTVLVAKDGREIPIDDSAAPIRMADGRVAGVIMVFRDITERKRAERRQALQEAATRVLAESESLDDAVPELLRLIGERLEWDAAALWTVDAETNCLRCHGVWHRPAANLDALEANSHERTFAPGVGLPGRVWLTGEPVWLPNAAEDPEFVRATEAATDGVRGAVFLPVQAGREIKGVVEVLSQRVEPFDPDVHVTLSSVANRIGHFLERKQAEQALQQAYDDARRRQREAESLASVARALSTLDLDTVLQTITERACVLLDAEVATVFRLDADSVSLVLVAGGGPRGATLNRDVSVPRGAGLVWLAVDKRDAVVSADLLGDPRFAYPPATRARIEAARHRVGLAVPLVVHGCITGALFVGILPGRAFSADDIRLVTAFADQAAIAIANAELYGEARRANRAKDEFLAMLSHELRTPLNTILGWARTLRTRQCPPEQTDHALAAIERNAQLQARLIEDLLDVSRIVSGKLSLEAQPVQLAAVIDAALDTVRGPAEAAEVTLAVAVDQTLPPLVGDAARLQQVVWNLLSNAIKFTERGGRVDVRARRVNGTVELVVADTGRGISPDLLPHVFDRFRQAEPGGSRATGGLGLGLTIVRYLVERHGGTVEAASPGEGGGATFTVRLPLSPEAPPATGSVDESTGRA